MGSEMCIRDSYWTAVKNGCDYVDKRNFEGGSQPDCRGTIFPNKDDDRMICHDNQE